MASRRNPFRKPPDPPLVERCPHGVRVGPFSRCQSCEDEMKEQARNPPAVLRIIESSTGRVVATHKVPPKKGSRMGRRPVLSPSYGGGTFRANADDRPRMHLRLTERNGSVAIGYRSRPDAMEKFADTIELALADMLDVSQPAVLIWEGITAAPRTPPADEVDHD